MDTALNEGQAKDERAMLRHAVATLAYRAEKVLRDVPPGFPDHRLGPGVRTPLELVGHLGDLIEWATRSAQGEWTWNPRASGNGMPTSSASMRRSPRSMGSWRRTSLSGNRLG